MIVTVIDCCVYDGCDVMIRRGSFMWNDTFSCPPIINSVNWMCESTDTKSIVEKCLKVFESVLEVDCHEHEWLPSA